VANPCFPLPAAGFSLSNLGLSAVFYKSKTKNADVVLVKPVIGAGDDGENFIASMFSITL